MVELILCEKPKAAAKLAEALADNKPIKKSDKGVPYYELTHKGKKIIVGCAVGHLFTLKETGKRKEYPIFDVEWVPTYKANKSAAFTKKYIDTLKKLSKYADEYNIACDYDVEGSTIGAICTRFIFNRSDAKRMKFSSLTKSELVKSYENATPHLDFPQIEAGETRHYADYFWGISSSRALTNSIKNATNQYKVMSTGRVQGPTLKIIVDREKEIQAFKSIPYWQIQLLGSVKNEDIEAWHKEDKFWKKQEADGAIEKTKGKKAFVDEVKRTKYQQLPPHPFDLTSLQLEAYRLFRINPNQTLQIAQNLYLAGIISYPRSASQQLPESLDYKNILKSLSRQHEYRNLCEELLKKQLRPNNGKKCVSGDTKIILSDGSIETVDKLVEKNRIKLTIPSLDSKDFKIKNCRVKDVFRTGKKRVYKIITQANDILEVTENHPFFALSNENYAWVEAKDLKENMFIATPSKINIKRGSKPSTVFEIFDLMDANIQNQVYIHFKCDSLRKKIKEKTRLRALARSISGKEIISLNTIRSYFQRNLLPYFLFKKIKSQFFSDKELEIFIDGYSIGNTGSGKKIYLPYNIDKEFMYFLGIISADGHNTGMEITIPNIRKLRDTFHKISKQFKIEVRENSHSCAIASKLLCEILHILNIYKYNKAKILDIHNLLLTQKEELLKGYIAGFFDGDGSIFKNNKGASFSFGSVSKKFLIKLKTLLLTFGIRSRFHKNHIRVYEEDNKKIRDLLIRELKIKKENLIYHKKYIERCVKNHFNNVYIPRKLFLLILKRKNLNINKLYEKGVKRIRLHENRISGDYYYTSQNNLIKIARTLKDRYLMKIARSDITWIKIRKIKKTNKNKFVYDLTTESRNFIGNNIILHNSDPAHPAVFSTGELPEKLTEIEAKIYDLIVRRTLATFAESAVRETMEIDIDVNKETFITRGTRTIEKGWHIFYGPYAIFEEQLLPDVKKGEEVKLKSINLLEKETQPPKRYTPASIIKKLEANQLGTKATRSEIVQTLYERGYIRDQAIQATPLGIKTIETLEKYSPDIIDVKLTRHFEKEMQDIQEGKRNKEQVLEEARKTLVKIFKHFKENELKIGKELAEANIQTREDQTIVGKCNKCEGNLRIMYSKKNNSYFIACSNYPTCRNTFSLTTGLPKPTNKTCKECSFPTVYIIRKGKRPFEYCINKECPIKKRWIENNFSQ